MAKRTKKIISVLLALIMVFGVIPVGIFTASAATEGVFIYSVNSKGEAQITGCDNSAAGDIVIPEAFGENPVKTIDLYAFSEKENITSVTIPDSVTKIGNNAFSDCTALKTVKIGSGVTDFADFVFSGCSALESIEVSSDNTILSNDESGVLYNKDKTELILYPAKNVSSTYSVADSVKTIKDGAFMGSANATIIVINDNVTKIGANAFLGSVNLETVIIGKSVSSIGSNAFEGCEKLTGINVSQENEVYSSDDDYILFNKDKTMLLKYPTGSSRKEYTIPSTVKEVSDLSFANSLGLEKITIPTSVKTIASSAFYSCSNIKNVIYEGTKSQFEAITIGTNNNSILGAKIEYMGEEEHEHSYVASVAKQATCTENGTEKFECKCGSTYNEEIPAKGHSFENNLCQACNVKEFVYIDDGTNAKITGYNGNATALIIPEKIDGKAVTAIGDNVFENRTAITTIAIPATVKDIGSNAFYRTGYYNKSSNWESGVLYIGTFLIEGQKLNGTSLIVKDGTTVIADYAFASMNKITSVLLPNSLITIGDSAFSGCTAIKTVTTKDTEDEFKTVVMGSNNESLTNADFTFYIPPHYHAYVLVADVKATCTDAGYKIEKCACGDEQREDYPALGHDFQNNLCTRCSEREYEIEIVGGGVKINGIHKSFSGTLEIPATIASYPVTAIGEKCFDGNESVTKVVIPATVTAIGKFAFTGSKISEIEVVNENASFSSENGILFNKDKTELIFCPSAKATETVEIPAGVKKIADGAFYASGTIVNVRFPESLCEIGLGAFAGCNAIESVYFAGTQTQWKNISISDNNDKIKSASFTFGNTSDTDAAKELASILVLENATAEVKDVEIIIKATANDVLSMSIADKTSNSTAVEIDCDGTAIKLQSNKYVLSVADWHKAGNTTTAQISTDKHTFTVKFVFTPINDGHNYGAGVKVEPTCTTGGCVRYTCSICSNVYETSFVAKLGHEYGNWVITTDETCTSEGVMRRECTVCDTETEGHYEYASVPKADHKYVAVTTDATCTEEGYTTYTCGVCNDSYVGDKVSALGHKYGEWNVIKLENCTEAGERNRTCTVCSDINIEFPSATGHDFTKVVTPPTYDDEGYTTYSCTKCDYQYDGDFVPTLTKVTGVTISDVVLYRDETADVSPVVDMVGNAQYTVSYKVADEEIATVDENGILTAKTRGTTTVTCTVTDTNGNVFNDTCTVEVKFTVWQWIKWFFVDVLYKLLISI